MSSSESSSTVNEISYGCPEYEIEDEDFETTSKDGYESEPSYAVEEELLDSMDSLAYTDEPLADELWVEEYERRQDEYTSKIEELNLGLNGQNPVNSWKDNQYLWPPYCHGLMEYILCLHKRYCITEITTAKPYF
jgi:hypothetical protein